MTSSPSRPVLRLERVSWQRDGRTVLSDITLQIESQDRWVVLGRNGSGKTTLARVAAWQEHPSSGRVHFGVDELGRCDARQIRRRIAFVSAAFADQIRPGLAASDVVMCARFGALEQWWHRYEQADRHRAEMCLDAFGMGWAANRPFGSLSSGERQRVLLGRAEMADPQLVILDEPCAGLDLAGREQLVDAMALLDRPLLLVTHHLEEIPTTASHVLLLADGRAVASGPIETTLDSDSLTRCFDVAVSVSRSAGRWAARARRDHLDEAGS